MENQATAQIGSSPVIVPEKVRYCLYARKSTEQDEKQALSIDSQIKEMLQIAKREGIEVVEIRRESHSAKAVGQREVFNSLLTDLRAKKFNGLLTWAPDRLSRNAGDLGALVDLMDQKLLVEIRTFGQRFTDNPNEKFLLMILGSQAKLENDNKRINVKRGLRARCEMGLWPSVAPTGYLSNPERAKKCEVIIDEERAPVIKRMFELVGDEGKSGRDVYKWLIQTGFKTKSGKPLSLSNVYIILNSIFYYGEFEYPKKSGKVYKGRHTAIITRELFDRTKKKLVRSDLAPMGSHEFAFTKLMSCGLCGSGVTADEKIKTQKNGNIHRYVYYGCTRSRDINCKSGYLREEELIKQLVGLIDKIDLDESGLRKQFDEEVARNRRFMRGVMGIKEKRSDQRDVDIRNFAKYILQEGTMQEQRALLETLQSKILLSNKKVSVIKQ
jgi:DNA invertase Pin-like site-specific DNA recombinase